MIKNRLAVFPALALTVILSGCAHFEPDGPQPGADLSSPPGRAIQRIKEKYAPDSHLAIFNVGLSRRGHELVLTGEVDRAEARLEVVRAVEQTGFRVADRVKVLPTEELGDEVWGISCLSVANAREFPEHKAEMGTQVLMGEVVRVWKRTANARFPWYLIQAQDGYLAWMDGGSFVRCTREQVDAWNRGPLLIVTAFEECIREQPRADAQPVSDVVMCDRVRHAGSEGDWHRVELPDGRTGYLPRRAAENFDLWKQERQATGENIERAARSLLGRPYLWGGNSTKGLDCSGLTQQVFFRNGVDLMRNASAQARQGATVPLDADLSQLQKGDLLFFGRRAQRGRPERVTHVGIYLGDKLFIQSSQRVRISSLDPQSPIRDEYRIRSLLGARRILNP